MKLKAFIRRRLMRWHVDSSDLGVGATLIRELSASIVPSGHEATWQRRPSISFDGTPIILSQKIGRNIGEALRVLVEPGSFDMTVAQQITFSLMRLDRLLGVLGWRTAAADINSIATQVFPSDRAATSGWWGGIWLGTNVLPSVNGSLSFAELRLYLNLRHGTTAVRWRTVATLVSSFLSPSLEPLLDNWLTTVSSHAIPVGLGLVVADGRVSAIRVYVGVYSPTLESLSALSSSFCAASHRELAQAHDSFTDRFGAMRPHAATIGYDFIRDMTPHSPLTIGRVKVDICCHLVAPEERLLLASWIKQLLVAWLFEPSSLEAFLDDVHAVWTSSEIQFLSLGFTSSLDHVTVYVKPGA